jgi:hypothetical protein
MPLRYLVDCDVSPPLFCEGASAGFWAWVVGPRSHAFLRPISPKFVVEVKALPLDINSAQLVLPSLINNLAAR